MSSASRFLPGALAAAEAAPEAVVLCAAAAFGGAVSRLEDDASFKAALSSINGARTYIAAMCCGMVGEALHVATTYGAQRNSFGRALTAHQG